MKKAMGCNACMLVCFTSLIFALFSLCKSKTINIYFDRPLWSGFHSVCGQPLHWIFFPNPSLKKLKSVFYQNQKCSLLVNDYLQVTVKNQKSNLQVCH